jgi:hypothetical protein
VSPNHPTPILVTPAELDTRSLYERVEAGNRVLSLQDTEAWADMRRGIAGKQAGLSAYLMGLPGDKDSGIFAKVTGEMAGVALIAVIATDIIADGEKAAQEIRAREEGS